MVTGKVNYTRQLKKYTDHDFLHISINQLKKIK